MNSKKQTKSRRDGTKRTMLYKIAIAIVLLPTLLSLGEDAVPPKIIDHLEGFTVIGVSVRTNNAKEQTPNGQIGKTWQRITQEKFLDKIPNKFNKNIVAAYTDYASDKDGDYTFILGEKVTSDKEVPEGMVAVKIPAGRYAKFTSEKGPAFKVVPSAWKRIWETPATAGNRAYKTDFEIYDQRAINPQNSQVDVYVGIKP